MQISKDDWLAMGERLYGKDTENWEFKCLFCERVQSAKSIREEQKKGVVSKRYGKLKKGDDFSPELCCYGQDCDYVANGLFTSGVLVILDPSQPHDEARKKNCTYVVPFAKEDVK